MVPGLHAVSLLDDLAVPLPPARVPYAGLVAENARRGHDAPEYELVDTGIFDEDQYWAVTVDFAKAAPEDVCIRITVENRGPDEAAIHLLPTLWLRNTWAWGLPGADAVPQIRAVPDVPTGTRLLAEHVSYGPLTLSAQAGGRFLFCDNETKRAAAVRRARALAVLEGRHRRSRRARCADGKS